MPGSKGSTRPKTSQLPNPPAAPAGDRHKRNQYAGSTPYPSSGRTYGGYGEPTTAAPAGGKHKRNQNPSSTPYSSSNRTHGGYDQGSSTTYRDDYAHHKQGLDDFKGKHYQEMPSGMGHGGDYPMKDESYMDDEMKKKAHEHLADERSTANQPKKKKGFVNSVVSAISKFGDFGNNAEVNFYQSDVRVIAETKSMASKEDLRCSQLIVTQPEEVIGEFVNGVVLQWAVPKPEHCEVTGLVVLILSDSGPVFEESASATATLKRIYGNKLRCGTIFKAAVKTKLKHCDGEPWEVLSDWTMFVTRPSRPKDVKVECGDDSANIQWSASRGAEKFVVSVFQIRGHTPLHCEETKGIHFSCSFQLSAFGIRLGQDYVIEVVAVRADLENPSGRTKHFFGKSDSPKSVVARIVEGTNKAILSWESPGGWSIRGYKYIIEVLPEHGPARTLPETSDTSVEIPDLKGGMPHNFRVATVGGSLWSTSNTIKTEACTIKVDKFRVEQNENNPAQSIDCTWDEDANAKEYRIRCKSSEKAMVVTIGKDTTRYTITGLTPNTSYKIAIKAADETGFGQYTNDEERSTGLSHPTGVNLQVVNRNEITATFVEAIGASGHKITLIDDDGKEIWAKLKSGETEHSFTGLRHSTEYRATVIALYGSAEGTPVSSESVLTAPEPPQVHDIRSIPVEGHHDSAFDLSFEIDKSIQSCQAEIKCKDEDDGKSNMEMDIDSEESRAFLSYKGFYEGVIYTARVRIKNSGGFSEWSGAKLIKTVPRKIESLAICCDKDKIVTEWKKVRHVKSYTIILFEEGEEICTKRDVVSPFTFSDEIEHGLKYFCRIFPENETGRGRTTTSNTLLAPLDPPTDLQIEDKIVRVIFSWVPSTGMRSAKTRFSNSEFEKLEYSTRKTKWSYQVTDGEIYTFDIWAQNGQALSKGALTEEFVTAPSEVVLRRNAINPETCLDVEIVTKYNGPFLLTWFEVATKTKEKVSMLERLFTVKNLKPATEYGVHALCVYGDNKDRTSQKCYSEEVMTLPAKVTGVNCVCRSTEECRELVWDDCGNISVEYTVTWARNNTFFKPLTTMQTSWKFKNLKSGNYSFRVSAGGGKMSDECFIIIPDAPQMQLEVRSWKNVRVVFSPKTLTEEKYWIKITRGNEDQGFEMETKMCKCIIGEGIFEKGVEYTITSKAYWEDQSGLATKTQFITGLHNPTDFKCELDHHNPERPVRFTWKKSRGMFSAKIKLREIYNRLHLDESTSDSCWQYRGLEPNRTYEFFLWPGDGQRFFFDDCVAHKFTTAPNPPKAVHCKTNGVNPGSFLIEIESDYMGPFLTEVVDKDKEAVKQHEGYEKSFTVVGLTPNSQYWISSQCVFGENVTRKTFATSPKIKII